MGMSASQARLLSITSRLTDNELRSQTITTAKMALATRSKDASANYMNALAQTELKFASYDAKGSKVYQNLTGTSLTEYAPLKNQYGIVNQHGQILISERDSMNYEDSADMYEFLDKYGVLAPEGEGEFIQVKNPDWDVEWGDYQDALREWKADEPDKNDEKYWKEIVNTNDELYQKFLAASKTCYNNAMGGAPGCYLHVLGHLLLAEFADKGDKGSIDYTTTTGDKINIGMQYINGSAINGAGKTPDMLEVSKVVCDPNNLIPCAENEQMKANIVDILNNPTIPADKKKVERLMNNYYLDQDGKPQLKTLKQKCIDLSFVLENFVAMGLDYKNDCIPMLITFQKDMEALTKTREFNEELYKQDYDPWMERKPEKPTVEYFIDKEVRKIENKDKGQWYINLWHRLNGESEIKAGTLDEQGNEIEGGETKSGLPSYKVLEDGLMNNPDWLKHAFENNSVGLERVDFTEKPEVGTGLADCEWNSIQWSNATDIAEEQNEVAVTLAEAQYKQALADIESKDQQYDNQLKNLDTEHSALQTEYDSVKGVIEKNIDRTLKLYS